MHVDHRSLCIAKTEHGAAIRARGRTHSGRAHSLEFIQLSATPCAAHCGQRGRCCLAQQWRCAVRACWPTALTPPAPSEPRVLVPRWLLLPPLLMQPAVGRESSTARPRLRPTDAIAHCSLTARLLTAVLRGSAASGDADGRAPAPHLGRRQVLLLDVLAHLAVVHAVGHVALRQLLPEDLRARGGRAGRQRAGEPCAAAPWRAPRG